MILETEGISEMESLFEKGVQKLGKFPKQKKEMLDSERLRTVMKGNIRKEVKPMTGTEERVKYLIKSWKLLMTAETCQDMTETYGVPN